MEQTKEDKAVQKTVQKLAAEETLAYKLYEGCIFAAKDSSVFQKLFKETAADELDDHWKKLAEYASSCGFKMLFKSKDLAKAAPECFEQVEKLKDGQDALYYIEEAIKSEKFAIASYAKALENESNPYELDALLLHNYYDELEHLERLVTMKNVLEAGAELV